MFASRSNHLALVFAALLCANTLCAEEMSEDCVVNADGITVQIKSILSPLYVAADDLTALKAGIDKLETLLLHAGHCTATARSAGTEVGDRERNIMEWHSMNQWLGRLVGSAALYARGRGDADWRDEYNLFAEIYDFTP